MQAQGERALSSKRPHELQFASAQIACRICHDEQRARLHHRAGNRLADPMRSAHLRFPSFEYRFDRFGSIGPNWLGCVYFVVTALRMLEVCLNAPSQPVLVTVKVTV